MRSKVILALIGVAAAMAAGVAAFWLRPPAGGPESAQPPAAALAEPAEPARPPTPIVSAAPPERNAPAASKGVVPQLPPPPRPRPPVHRAERLAQLWTNQLTEGQSRALVLLQEAIAMLDSDPAAAFALGEQLPAEERRQFSDSLFVSWAQKDTDAALQWAGQLSDDTERDTAIKAIRSAAPVGIGAELRMQDGYAVINRLVPGTPAELGGLLRPGDRILAVAQGNHVFVDAHGMALKDLVEAIRGEPGTLLQLQVLPADAPLDSLPRMVSIVRDQVKFKQ